MVVLLKDLFFASVVRLHISDASWSRLTCVLCAHLLHCTRRVF